MDIADDLAKINGSAFGPMTPEEAAKYSQFWDDVAAGKSVYERLNVEDPISKLKTVGKQPYIFSPYDDDPAKTVVGSGKSSNPLEFQQTVDDLLNQGVEFNYKYDNAHKGYSPKNDFHNPQITMPEDISYSGLIHEQQHYLDDLTNGFQGTEFNFQPINRVKAELNAYMKEIHLAEQAGNKVLANQLFENYIRERNMILFGVTKY